MNPKILIVQYTTSLQIKNLVSMNTNWNYDQFGILDMPFKRTQIIPLIN